MRKKSAIKLVLTLVVLVVLVVCWGSRADLSWAAFLEAVRRFTPAKVALVLFFEALQLLFMILRMMWLSPGPRRAPFIPVGFAIAIGQTVNSLMPARAGEPFKWYWLGRIGGEDPGFVARGGGWCVADRTLQMAAFFLLIPLSGVVALPAFHQALPFSPWWIVLGGFGLILLPFGVLVTPRMAETKVGKWIHRLKEGLSGLRHPVRTPIALGFSFGMWLTEAAALWVLVGSLGFSLSFAEIYFVAVVLNLSIAFPISVANLGTFEASLVFALHFFGVELPQALAVAAGHHLFQLLAVVGWAGVMTVLRRRSGEAQGFFDAHPPPAG